MIRRLYLHFQLWRRGYCTKHLRLKTFGFYWGTKPYCTDCYREQKAKRDSKESEDNKKLQRWLKELG